MREAPRPKEVTEAQARHLKENPACAISGRIGSCQAHHILDYDACNEIGRPKLAEDPRNFITLAESEAGKPEPNLHLLCGHLGSFRSINLDLIEELPLYRQWWANKTTSEIEADPLYLARKSKRPKPVSAWDSEDIAFFRNWADKTFPEESNHAN